MTMTASPTATKTGTDWARLAREIGDTFGPSAADRDRSGEISLEAFESLRKTGATSALVPVEFGGGGASHAEVGGLLRELGRRDPSTAVAFSMHCHLVAAQVWRHRHGVDASALFRKVVADRAVLISTGASDWVASSGSARRVEGGYRVNARKSPASGCEAGHVLVTSIRWGDAPDGPKVLHCAVPFGAEGVRIERTWDTLGLRATGSHTVVLDEVFVPDAAVSLIRPADQWHPVWNVVIGAAMPLILSAYLGIADAAVELARDAVAGRPAPHTFQLLGEMVNAHTTAADVVAAAYLDADDLRFAGTDDLASRTLARKTVATGALIETVRLAIEVAGGVGYTRSSDLERLYRDVHGCLFHPLPRARQTTFTGRVALGLSPVE
ncbi:MAG: acyl-CoA/acyl-ACP dehydrogenase [Holophagales bacterium]|nr:acyl-CoA/acyl-ACP dehydrogenase [Holophagales bacterium]